MIANQVDCIVRFHDVSRLNELNRCIFSLVGQKHRPVHIILATQRFSESEIIATQKSIEPLLKLPNAPKLTIRNWENPAPKDARSELLNMGLSAATGQYVSFLDYDDVLYPEAYSVLTDRLQETGAAIAFCSVRLVTAEMYRHFIHITGHVNPLPFKGEGLADLFRGNFCPIHSFLIDRSIVSPEILSFDPTLSWEEDYDLLLKICAAYPSDFGALKKIIGEYYYKTDGSNSVPISDHQREQRAKAYERVSARIEARRIMTHVAPAVQRQLGLDGCHELTIREAMNALNRREPAD